MWCLLQDFTPLLGDVLIVLHVLWSGEIVQFNAVCLSSFINLFSLFRTCIRQSPADGEGSFKSDWRGSQRQQLPVYQREVCHHQEH